MSALSFIVYKDLYSWDVKNFLKVENIFKNNIPVKLFGDFLTKANIKKIDIVDNQTYKILGVRSYGKGVYINRIVKGDTLRMRKYQLAKKDHLFWCKVDTKNGAFGIITDELSDGIASSNMIFAEVDTTKIYLDYLQLLFRSVKINSYMDSYVTGTTNRKYIKFDELLKIKIPLPSPQQQEEILKKYNAKIELAKQQEQEAKKIEDSIEEYLFEELGIEKLETKKEKSGLQFVEFKDIDRWDTQYLIGNIPSIKSKYELELFSNAITCFNKDKKGNSLRINSKNFPEDKFLYIGMEHIEKETGTLLEQNIVFGKEIKSQTLRVPREFILYGKLRPYLNKYWINDIEKDNIICSSEFFVFDIDENINKLYFKYCLSSSFIQQQISDKTSGARMPRINEDIFMNLKFPLPPLNIQEKIANEITKRKEKIKQLKQEAQKNGELAIKEFEREIFDE